MADIQKTNPDIKYSDGWSSGLAVNDADRRLAEILVLKAAEDQLRLMDPQRGYEMR